MADPFAALVIHSFSTNKHLFTSETDFEELMRNGSPFDLPLIEVSPKGADNLEEHFKGFFQDGPALTAPGAPSHPTQGVQIAAPPVLHGQGPDTDEVADPLGFPGMPIGKIAALGTGNPEYGTAWLIGPTTAVTAGHCVLKRNTGTWALRLLFAPGWRDGATHLGPVSTAIAAATLRGWAENRDARYDLAVIKLDRAVGSQVGWLGWQSYTPPTARLNSACGYPIAPAPHRNFLDRLYRSNGVAAGHGALRVARNDLTAGSSGGPWLEWNGAMPLATGITAGRASADPMSAVSPLLVEGFLNLVNWGSAP